MRQWAVVGITREKEPVLSTVVHRNHPQFHSCYIIELVVSICKDSTDMQYMTIQKISQNLKNGQLII